MNYLELTLCIEPFEEYVVDILSSQLADIGFESFVQEDDGLHAFVLESLFDRAQFDCLIKNFSFGKIVDFKIDTIVAKNWNEEWEKNFFQPIVIGDECVIHSSFHQNVPQAKYDIVIDPKMSFGTGHHETTSLMIEQILKIELEGKSVLDMGCGTSVLAILAFKCGAKSVTAIDIDPWCIENSKENLQLNNAEEISLHLGDAELLKNKSFDIIIANINRNILLNDMSSYANALPVGGELLMSGFYASDIPKIEEEAKENGLVMQYFKEKNNWVVVRMRKG